MHDFYLIEPYNAWQKHSRKKHPSELAEEEALYYRIVQEALHQQMTQNDSVTNAVGQVSNATGAGGIPPYSYFHPSSVNLIEWEPANLDAISMLGIFAYDNTTSLNGVTDLSILCSTNREGIDIQNAPDLVNLSFPNLTAITEGGYFSIQNCFNLTTLTTQTSISTTGNITLTNNSLNQSSIDNILLALVNGGSSNITFDSSVGRNATTSSFGSGSASVLRNRGWTVITN